MTDPARIVLDPGVLAGKPVIRGTRLSVDFVIGLMADGWTEGDILRNYPGVSHEAPCSLPCLRSRRAEVRKSLSKRRVKCAFSLTRISPARRCGRSRQTVTI